MAIRKTNDGIEIIKHRFGVDPGTDPHVQAFADEFHVAQMIYDARCAAGKSQKELADSIGEAESVIVDIEAADYDGDSMSILRRIADALHMKLRLELVPADS
jgi:ribosome-binding protein aMBF1 (putative translation factor)